MVEATSVMAESDLKVNRCQWWWRTQQVAPLLVEMSQPGQNILCMVWKKLTGLGGRCTRTAQRGYSVCRVLIVDEVTNEAVRTPTSEPFSVSLCQYHMRCRVENIIITIHVQRKRNLRNAIGSCCPVQLARALGLVVSSLIQFMAPYHTNGLIAEVNHRDQAWISP